MTRNTGGGRTAEALGLLFVAAVFMLFESTRTFGLILLGLLIALIVGMVIWTWARSNKAGTKFQEELLSNRIEILNTLAERGLASHRAEMKVSDVVFLHIETLANRRDALVRVDRYGVVDGSEWNREVQQFIDKVVRPRLSKEEWELVASLGESYFLPKFIEDRVAKHCETRKAPLMVPSETTPLDFEGICAAVLRQHGWNATTTKGSGDQGADVIAERSGTKIVLQCKLYTGNVGNKAVQEALAAKHFYSADIAAVVCKSDYSKAAKQLAQASGVEIMTYTDLGAFADRAAKSV